MGTLPIALGLGAGAEAAAARPRGRRRAGVLAVHHAVRDAGVLHLFRRAAGVAGSSGEPGCRFRSARLVEAGSGAQSSRQPLGSYAFPGVPPSAMIVVPGSLAMLCPLHTGAGEDEGAGGRVDPVTVELDTARPRRTR